jgi:hypothetical protein
MAHQRTKPRTRRKIPTLRIPVAQAKLPARERKLLKDPNWVTEDDADVIIGMRRLRREKPIPLEKVLKRYGYRVEG